MADVNDALANLLVVAANRISRIEASVLGQLPTPLTYSQFRLLARVAEGHHTLMVLASFAGLSMPTLSESVSGLVRRGLLVRHPSPVDGRAIMIHITPEGRQALRAGMDALHGASLELLTPDLGDDEAKEDFYRKLLSIYDRAEAFLPSPITRVRRGLSPTERLHPEGGTR